MAVSDIVDRVLEAPVVPSFTKIGYGIRARLDGWTPLDEYDLSGRVIVVTGATSGLGKAAAHQFARCGAALVLNGRSEGKNERVRAEVVEASGNDDITTVAADMGDLAQVRAMADAVLERHDRIEVLIHNAGALSDERREAPDGTEATVASQVVGPFLLTSLLLDRLSSSAPARVLTMSSGGMYSQGLTVRQLEMGDDYAGATQYARAKRAQVTLNEMWAERFADRGVRFHALHPGWAATPGVEDALPTFNKVLGPLLRSADEGADTLVWLAADDGEPLETNGTFWLDRRPRSLHKTPMSKKSDTPKRRVELWDWVVERAGVDPGAQAE
ncbi:MAG: SDR family NAD(P)-dependent oxidoreductase [Actinomycetota bacterium]